MDDTRKLCDIAAEIKADWSKQGKGISPHALPYLDAMSALFNTSQSYGYESADGIVRYFLSNASTWRGETAKRVKAELKSML